MGKQPLLEGTVVDPPNSEVARLREALNRMTEDRDNLEVELLKAQKSGARLAEPVGRLRDHLGPLYQYLQVIFGDMDEIAPAGAAPLQPTSTSAPAQPANDRTSATWESWKQKLGGAAAKIITALQGHTDADVTQLCILTATPRRNTIYDGIYKLNKAGLINKNGDRFSLKQL